MSLVALSCSFLLLSPPTNAQETNTATTSPETADLTQGIITNGPCVGGTTHANILDGNTSAWDGSTAVQFGACSDQFAISMAINQALSHTGISVDKLHYKWKWINGCFNVTTEDGTIYCDQDISNRLDENFKPTGEYADQFDTLNIVVTVTDANGNVVETKTYDYDTWYHWAQENSHSDSEVVESCGEGCTTVWQVTEDFIEFFNHQTGAGTIYTPSQLGNVSFVTTGQDNGQWEGFYGPVVKDGEMWFTYTTNPCELDKLYHPTCEGYAEAYTEYLYNKACDASPLYDSGCTGYAAAFLDQQCTLDSLYDQQCPMYQVAYFNQQCELDSQYDIACPNYQPEVVEEIIAQPIIEVIPEISVIPEVVIPEPIETPQVEIVTEIEPVEEITTQSIEIEIAELEEAINDEEPKPDETTESEPTTEPVKEKEEDPEKEESEETTEDDTNDESVDDKQVEDEPKKEEKPQPVIVEKKEPTETEIQEKKESRKEKIKQLIADKIAEMTKQVNDADTIEEQMILQAKLVALIAFVPDFDYGEKDVPDIYFYPPKPTVDHEFARWFVNDPTFGVMEDLQYPNLR